VADVSRRGKVSRRYGCRNITSSEAARRFIQSQRAKGLPVAAEHCAASGILTVTDHTMNRIEVNVARCPEWLPRAAGNTLTVTDANGRSFMVRLSGPPEIILGANPDTVEFDSSVLGGVG
jgi:hypothetical protein